MPTKTQIAEVALDLFMKDGYDGVSIKNITDALSITKGSLYYHYEGKEALFHETVNMFLERIYSRFGLKVPEEIDSTVEMFDFFKRLFSDTVNFLGEKSYDVGYIHMIIQGKKDSKLLEDVLVKRYDDVMVSIKRILSNDIKKGKLKSGLDLDNLAIGIVAVFEGFILMWMNTNKPSLKKKISDMFDANLKALIK